MEITIRKEVVEYRVLQCGQIKKLGSDPTVNAGIVKLTRRVGSTVFTTGCTWTGPQGGEWVELDPLVERQGWLLVQGPGFGTHGPLLQRVDTNEEPPIVLHATRPLVGDEEPGAELETFEFVVTSTTIVKDVKAQIALNWDLDPACIIITSPGQEMKMRANCGDMGRLLSENDPLSDAGFEDGDEVAFAYIGSLEGVGVGRSRRAARSTKSRKSLEAPQGNTFSELEPHFKTLGLADSTPQDEIKRQYRRLALECHPDKHPGEVEAATQKFQQVTAAYEAIRGRLNF